MERLIEILTEIKGGIDYTKAEGLVTDKLIDSIDISSLIAALEDEFDIEIGMEYMENKNFDSAEAIWNMIRELKEE